MNFTHFAQFFAYEFHAFRTVFSKSAGFFGKFLISVPPCKIFLGQLEESSQNIISIVDSILEEEKLTRKELVIGGFSQGGALALNIALKHYTEVGGILAMSTFLPVDANSREWLDRLEGGAGLPGPISQHHGDSDPMVRIENALRGKEILEKFAKEGEYHFHTYRGLQHSSCTEEMANVDQFINKVLNV